MIRYSEEHFSKIFEREFKVMFNAHWKEIGAFNKQKVNLAPNWPIYRALGDIGKLKLFTVRNDGNIVGYQLFIIDVHPHYSKTKMAESDAVYLYPEFRKGFIGYNFLKFCIKELHDDVDVIIMNTKAGTSYDIILKRLKFKIVDYKFALEIK